MKYLYGPVKSRRLGLSLGVTLLPQKVCSFNCIYCQLGKTANLSRERKEYLKPEEILEELKSWLANNADKIGLDYITLCGSGEPTLNTKVKEIIQEIKKITTVPVVVITNACFLNDLALRQALSGADLIVPSLDAVTEEVFKKINRPEPTINIEDIINGLINLRKEFSGKIWLEVMLVRGVNDDLRQLKKMKEVIERINPDKIQLNSPVRTTAEADVFAVDKKKLEKIKEILGDKCEII